MALREAAGGQRQPPGRRWRGRAGRRPSTGPGSAPRARSRGWWHGSSGVGPSRATIALYEKALALAGGKPDDVSERIRASLAWGLLHLHSGDFDKARAVGEETRALAMAAGLAREVGEASALMGLCAMMQGRWKEVFQSEFIAWAQIAASAALQAFASGSHIKAGCGQWLISCLKTT